MLLADPCEVPPAYMLGRRPCLIFVWLWGWKGKRSAFWVSCVENRAKPFGLDRVWVKASLLPGFVTSDGLVDFPMPAAALLKWERYPPIGIWRESEFGGTSYVPGSMPVLEEC